MAFCLSGQKVLHCESTNLLYVGFFLSVPRCARTHNLVPCSLKGQEPAPAGCWELPLELHGADRRHSLHLDGLRDPAPLRVPQPHRPAQSHGKRHHRCLCFSCHRGSVTMWAPALLRAHAWMRTRWLVPVQGHPQLSSSCSLSVAFRNDVFGRTKYFVPFLARSATCSCALRGPGPANNLPSSLGGFPPLSLGVGSCHGESSLWGCSAVVLVLQDSAKLKGTQHGPPQGSPPMGELASYPICCCSVV